MPDWLIHLGSGYLVTPSRWRLDPRPLALGLILPDLSYGLGIFLDKTALLPPSQGVAELGTMLHTPFSSLALCLVLALPSLRPGRTFLLLAWGVLLHLLLDLTQGKVGNGVLLFFPWSCREVILTPFRWQEGGPALVLQLISLALCWRWYRCRRPETLVAPHWFLRAGAGFLLALALGWFCGTQAARLRAENAHGFGLMAATAGNPGTFLARLNYCGVVWPDPLMVRYGTRNFYVVAPLARPFLKRGDQICLTGTARGATITADFLSLLPLRQQKEWASLLGFCFLLLLWTAELRGRRGPVSPSST